MKHKIIKRIGKQDNMLKVNIECPHCKTTMVGFYKCREIVNDKGGEVEMSKVISVDVGLFEHLLNCLANQKFIDEQLPKPRKEWQAKIDEAWNKGMTLLSEFRKKPRSKGVEMQVIHPHKDETYRIGFDDKCLVVSSGSEEDSPKVWISESMLDWIAINKLTIFKEQKVFGIEFRDPDWWKQKRFQTEERMQQELSKLAEGQGKDYSSKVGGVEGQKEPKE